MTRVHIVGGGVSGLAVARQLPTDWEVHLYEHSAQGRPVPTLFSIFPAGRRALGKMGLSEVFNSVSLPVDSGRFYDSRGGVLAQLTGLDVRLIPRPDLLTLLSDRLPGNVRLHRRTIRSSADLDGSLDKALIIGADGVHSVVRREEWSPRSAPHRLAVTAIRGVIDDEDPQVMIQEVWRAGGAFGLTPRPGGGANWYATVPRRHFSDSQEAIETLQAHWAGAAGPAARVLEHATPEQTLVNDLWQSRWPGSLVRNSSVLVGDAAHAMSPSLGRGANESLIDALVLGEALRTMPVPHALRRYQRKRLLATQSVKHASGGLLRLSSTRQERLRSALLRLVPNG